MMSSTTTLPPAPPGKGPPEYKATSLVFLRRFLHERTPESAKGLALLTDDERQALAETVATEWVGIHFASRVYVAAAAAISDDLVGGLREAGRRIAHDTLGGPYALVMRVMSVAFAVRSSARMWSLYHRVGRVVVDDKVTVTDNDNTRQGKGQVVRFTVHDYPHMPAEMREAMAGWIVGLAEICGESTPQVLTSGTVREGFTFHCTW